jgi:hemoglobin
MRVKVRVQQMSATIKHPHGHEYPAPPPNPVPRPEAVTLFERLGGRPGIQRLIKWFYARVRFEPDLRPIFDAHITQWGPHLELLIDYWCGVAGGPSTYRGTLDRHVRLGLEPSHFATWLRVWEENCRDILQPREAGEMIALAHTIAKDLQQTLGHGPSARGCPFSS